MLPALALVHACGALVVEADDPALRQSVQSAFAERADIDTCARVTLTSRSSGTIVTVTLADGRSTTRVVRAEAVLDALEPLLVVPEEDEPDVAPATSTATTFRVESPEPVVIVVEHDRASPSAAPSKPSPLAVEASLALGARLAEERVGAGIGGAAVVDVNGWLGGVMGRFDAYDAGGVERPFPEETRALSIAALAGRRQRFGIGSFDVYGGVGAAQLWTTAFEPEVRRVAYGSSGALGPSRSEMLVPQFTFGTRLTLRARSLVRVFLAVEGDLRSGDDELLPRWSLGAALGLTVGS